MSDIRPREDIEQWLTLCLWPIGSYERGDEAWRWLQCQDILRGAVNMLATGSELKEEMQLLSDIARERGLALLQDMPDQRR